MDPKVDVHLTDTNDDNGRSVASIWTEIFTECVERYVATAFQSRKVRIFNLLCDHHYVHAVQWHALSRNCSVFHLASPTLEDVHLLPPAGLILNSLLLDPGRMETLERDKRNYQLSDLASHRLALPVQKLFISRVGVSKRDAA